MTIATGGRGKPVYGTELKVPARKTVTTAGTAEQLTATAENISGLYISALSTNTGNVYIGGSDVDSTNGYILANTDTHLFIPIGDPSLLYLDVATSGEGVAYWCF